jgi:hypothetical protein
MSNKRWIIIIFIVTTLYALTAAADTVFAFTIDFGFRRQILQTNTGRECGIIPQINDVLGWNPNGERTSFHLAATTGNAVIYPGTCGQKYTWGNSCEDLKCVTENSVIAISLRGGLGVNGQHTTCAVDDISHLGRDDHSFSINCNVAPKFGQVLQFAIINPPPPPPPPS